MEIFKMISDYDGLEIAAAHRPVENPRAVLQIVHGMAEHKERYFPFMEYLAERGIASFINDHRGHGGSVKDPKDLGYFGDNGADALLSDMNQLTRRARDEYPVSKLFMLSHSMGSLAARAYIQKYGSDIEGLMVSGNPGYSPAAPMGIKIARRAQERRGDHARCRILTAGILGPFMLHAPSRKTVNAWISTDMDVVCEYDREALCGFEFYANGYEALLTLMVRANDPNAPAPNRGMPVKFFSGGDDACMGGEKKLRAAAQLLRNAGYVNVDVKLYPGMRHEILNERGRERVYADMAATIDEWLC